MNFSTLRVQVNERIARLSKSLDNYERAKTFGAARRRPHEIVAEFKDDLDRMLDVFAVGQPPG